MSQAGGEAHAGLVPFFQNKIKLSDPLPTEPGWAQKPLGAGLGVRRTEIDPDARGSTSAGSWLSALGSPAPGSRPGVRSALACPALKRSNDRDSCKPYKTPQAPGSPRGRAYVKQGRRRANGIGGC